MMDSTDPPAPMILPAYTGPDPASGVTTSMNEPAFTPGGLTWTTCDDFAAIWTTWPSRPVAGVLPVAVAIRTEAALPGADSTSAVPGDPAGLAASTPCSSTGPAPGARTPTVPAGPPGSSMAATTGTLDVIDSAPAMPPRDGNGIADTDPPSRSMPVPPVGWYEPRWVIAVILICAAPLPGTAMYKSRDPGAPGKPGMTRCRAGAGNGGSQPPAWPANLLSRTAATTWPTVVLTFSAMMPEPCSRPSSDWTTMPCGGTVMPLSALPSTGGPLAASVTAWTCASAGVLPVFVRYSSIVAADFCPGPANQKFVPGAPHWAVTSPPGPVCSTSRPCASAPVALTWTPPRPACVRTLGLEPGWPASSAAVSARATGTEDACSTPGRVSVARVGPADALPTGDSGVTTAEPVAAEPGTAATASAEAVGAAEPGAGQTRIALETSARLTAAERTVLLAG